MTAAAAISGGIVRIGDCGAAFGGAQFDGAPGDSGPDARASGDRAPGDEDGGRGSRDVSRHAHGGIRLLIVGHCLLAGPARDAALAAAVRAGDLGRVAAWPGAYSAIVLSQGTATAYGDLSDQFPLYYSQRGGEVLIAADPAALAVAHGREPDPLTAAVHIACPGVLPLWQGRSPYAGVSRLPGGAVLRATRGSVVVQPAAVPLPVAGRSLEEGGALLRAALVSAVGDRCAGRPVSADFSGGLDSTSIAFLAAASARPPVAAVAYHQPLAPAGDLPYAVRYAALDPRLRLEVVAGTERTLPFAGPASSDAASEPHPGWLAAERSLTRLTAARESGARLHLTGEGGDAILMSAPSYLATLARRGRPLTLLRHGAAYARLRQASPAGLVGQAVRLAGTTAQRALSDLAAQLAGAAPRAGRWADFIAWWPLAGTAATWLTTPVRRQLADVAADPATARVLPADASPADLAALTDVRRSGDAQRQLRELAAPLGLEVHAPFLDRAVIRAALSVPAPVRANPWTYKPLLGAALGGLLPAEIFGRRTKGDYAAEDYAGARAALPWLRNQLRDSRLAALGVIEPGAVTAALDRMAAGIAVPLGPLNTLLATESWLRSTEEPRSGAPVSW
jgi:asparagine synthase (glutamine-hydrolysing)